MAQIAVPIANSGTTSWVEANGDGDGDWFDEMDEGVASQDGDTTAWRSMATPNNAAIGMVLAPVTDPGIHTGHIIRAVWRKSAAGGMVISGTLQLYEGVTLIAQAANSDITSNSHHTFSYTLSEMEAAAITDYSNLGIVVVANNSGGSPARTLVLTAVELEVPDPVSGGTDVPIGQATETDTAQPMTVLKTVSTGQAVETDVAQPVSALKTVSISQATETDLAHAVTIVKVVSIGQAVEQDTAQPVTVVSNGMDAVLIGQATETDTAQPMTVVKVVSIGQAMESNAAQPVSVRKTVPIGQATETDLAQPVAAVRVVAIGQATEQDTALSVTPRKVVVIGQAVETDIAQPVSILGMVVVAAFGVVFRPNRTGSVNRPNRAGEVHRPSRTGAVASDRQGD